MEAEAEAEVFAAQRRGAAAEGLWYRGGLWVPSMLEGNAVDDSANLAAYPLPAAAMGEGGDEEAEEQAEEGWAREDVVHLERVVPQGVVPYIIYIDYMSYILCVCVCVCVCVCTIYI